MGPNHNEAAFYPFPIPLPCQVSPEVRVIDDGSRSYGKDLAVVTVVLVGHHVLPDAKVSTFSLLSASSKSLLTSPSSRLKADLANATDTMATNDILQTFLQIHLASDSSSVIHLPFILQNLNVQILENSGHRSKWNARISSLIHSRESGARWAGLCIARQCAVLSKSFIAQSGQGWVSVVLPMLSVRPVLLLDIVHFLTHSRRKKNLCLY